MITADTAETQLHLHLLDVGTEKYGDCLLVQLGKRTILIDGAHAGDWKPRNGTKSIPDQLITLLGQEKVITVDLLIITHCHADHIGCLPTLIKTGVLRSTWALVADEKLGFGREATDDAPPVAPRSELLAAGMREEDHSDMSDVDIEQFLQDAASLEQRYSAMLKQLIDDGTKLFRYGRDNHAYVEKAFADFGLEVIGPTREHLAVCANSITELNQSASSSDALASEPSLTSWYRSMVSGTGADNDEQDRPGKGAALNNQSIVLKVAHGGASMLLAGDMQFAQPEISGLEEMMTTLRGRVKAAGPYAFIKLTHHASYNGIDDSVLKEWSDTKSFAHSGGLNDSAHPDPSVLNLLEKHGGELQWARTDHNGHVTVTLLGTHAVLAIDKGRLNDATPNVLGKGTGVADIKSAPASPAPMKESITGNGVSKINLSARLDASVTKFTVSFEIEHGKQCATASDVPRTTAPTVTTLPKRTAPEKAIAPQASTTVLVPPTSTQIYALPRDRTLPKLLFVSNAEKLGYNIGTGDAQAVFAAIRSAGQTLYQVTNPSDPFPEIRKQLESSYEGVVIVGGYDVLPSTRLDTLPPSLRQSLGQSQDADNFIVWSDAPYGDRDGDLEAEVPVSRIPDARSPKLVAASLGSKLPITPVGRFGVRNDARPFAEDIFSALAGPRTLLVSGPATPSTVGVAYSGENYYMLHGSNLDGTSYVGEGGGSYLKAMDLTNVPTEFRGVILAGCCWAALTVDSIASQTAKGQTPAVRNPKASLALMWLQGGARAFVGCTGSHYSPTVSPYHYFGGPMHSAFWQRYNSGQSPAQALFGAKLDFFRDFPHGQITQRGQAIELKTFRQFTCLGLGW